MTSISITNAHHINTLRDLARSAERRGSAVPKLPAKGCSLKGSGASGDLEVAIDSGGDRSAYFAAENRFCVPLVGGAELVVNWYRQRGRKITELTGSLRNVYA